MRENDFPKLGICVICGVVFGIAAQKGRVAEPRIIRGQMDFTIFTMMKMFLAAVSSGMVSMAIVSMMDGARRKFMNARGEFNSCLTNKGFFSALIGGGMLGAGMTLAGSCPGMVLVQVGSQTPNSLYTLLGGLAGVLLYTVLEPAVVQLTKPSGGSHGKTLDNRQNYASTALPLAAMLACAIAGLEMYYPEGTTLSSNLWTASSWPAYVAGAVIGALQIPVILSVGDTLGTSTSYCTVLSQLLITDRLNNAFSYLSKYRTGLKNWWQVMFVGGAVGGAYLSARASGSLAAVAGVSQYHALLGGGLMLFGARFAAGCTSGHGLSGMALLVVNSFVAVGAMFAGGAGTMHALSQGWIN